MNEPLSFETLYAQHAARVYRLALRLTGNREEAEDLAAESLAEAFRTWGGYRGESAPETWLHGIVLNRWRMIRRKRKVPTDPLRTAETVATTFRSQDLELAEALGALPTALREAFLLVKGEGFTHSEAASVLKIPVGTVYFRVHVAIRKLRVALGPIPGRIPTAIEVTFEQEL